MKKKKNSNMESRNRNHEKISGKRQRRSLLAILSSLIDEVVLKGSVVFAAVFFDLSLSLPPPLPALCHFSHFYLHFEEGDEATETFGEIPGENGSGERGCMVEVEKRKRKIKGRERGSGGRRRYRFNRRKRRRRIERRRTTRREYIILSNGRMEVWVKGAEVDEEELKETGLKEAEVEEEGAEEEEGKEEKLAEEDMNEGEVEEAEVKEEGVENEGVDDEGVKEGEVEEAEVKVEGVKEEGEIGGEKES
jgi:hypothetical protein